MAELTPYQIHRRQLLTSKLAEKTITKQEAAELKGILEIEKSQALQLGDIVLVLAIGFLLAIVIALLAGENR